MFLQKLFLQQGPCKHEQQEGAGKIIMGKSPVGPSCHPLLDVMYGMYASILAFEITFILGQ